MNQAELSRWVVSCLLLGLRIGPVFAFAPPFTLIRMPRFFQLLLGLGMSVTVISSLPQERLVSNLSLYGVSLSAMRELALGVVIVLAFQAMFGALYLVGRTIDIQAGYGFALLVDPKSQAPVPLVGTMLAYIAAGAFFLSGGHIELLKILATSLNAVPIGQWSMPGSIEPLEMFLSEIFLIAFGVAGSSILALFLLDAAVTLLSRTVPQMNVLVLGFQIKSLVLFIVLPLSVGLGASVVLRMIDLTFQILLRII